MRLRGSIASPARELSADAIRIASHPDPCVRAVLAFARSSGIVGFQMLTTASRSVPQFRLTYALYERGKLVARGGIGGHRHPGEVKWVVLAGMDNSHFLSVQFNSPDAGGWGGVLRHAGIADLEPVELWLAPETTVTVGKPEKLFAIGFGEQEDGAGVGERFEPDWRYATDYDTLFKHHDSVAVFSGEAVRMEPRTDTAE